MKKEVSVKLRSVQRDLETDEKICVSFSACGVLDEKDGALRLRFTEPSENDLTASEVELIFSNPAVMKKSGQASVEMVFTRERSECVYKTPMGLFELAISDAEVSDNVTPDGGTFLAEYISALRGLDRQRIRMRIDVTVKEEAL